MNIQSLRFYVTDMMPNGTRDLIVTDTDSQIIGVISEAVFGGRTTDNYATALVADADSVWACQREARHEDDVLDQDLGKWITSYKDHDDEEDLFKFIEANEVWNVDYDWVLRYMAVSPVLNKDEALKRLENEIRGIL